MEVITSLFLTQNNLGKEEKEIYVEIKMKKKLKKFWKVRKINLRMKKLKKQLKGSVPFGYTKENKKLKINEDEASIVKRIFEDYASGKTILQICRDFEEEGITNKGGKFVPQTVRHILKREEYTGIYVIHGKTYDKIYPPIISKELFQTVKERLDANRYGCRKDNHEIFRFKDKIYCGCCDRKMYPVSAISFNG